jgi:hypothetical protein
MAHTYAIVKSWVDLARPGVHCGYVNITMADDYSSGYSITASDINPNLSTLYRLEALSGNIGGDNCFKMLMWDYTNQKWVSHVGDDGLVEGTAGDLDAAVIYCYYEGS